MSLREVCRQDEMPALSSVMLWLSKEDWFSEQYARAKAAGVEALAEEMLDIADNAANDWMERNDKDGENAGWAFNGEAAQRSRIRIDTRKWLLSKLAPKKYGDKVEQTVKGDPDAPIEHKVTHTFSQDAADLLSKVRGATG
jgi:hypothetical protein